jgi:hypothetical protein
MADEVEQASETRPVRRRHYRPAYETAAVRAALRAEDLAENLITMALTAETDKDQLAATKLLFDMEHRVRQERRDEEDHFARLQGQELQEALNARLDEILEIDDADVVEDGD